MWDKAIVFNFIDRHCYKIVMLGDTCYLILYKIKKFQGNALRIHDNRPFSAFDRDMDSLASDNCARERGGGWWHFSCGYSNLNGVYYEDESRVEKWRGLLWFQWKGAQMSLQKTTMMIRRVDWLKKFTKLRTSKS